MLNLSGERLQAPWSLWLGYTGPKHDQALILETFLFLIQISWDFSPVILYENCYKNYSISFLWHFYIKGVKGLKNAVLQEMKIFIVDSILM